METLRPELFRRLESRFKKVKISKQGEANRWHLKPDINGKMHRCFDKNINDCWGEYYRVCCPHCNDTRFRLSINHMWGARDESSGDLNLWLIECHNENCLRDAEQQWVMYRQVMMFDNFSFDRVFKGKAKPTTPGEVDWPGTVYPLDRLAPDHPARVYLLGRNFDPDWLAQQFRVGVLIDPKPNYQHLRDRLVIPQFNEGKLVGYQTRLITENAPPGTRKYMTAKDFPRGQFLYNIDSALLFPFVVVVEGPPDVWRFGPEAVALLGKQTGFQTHLLETRWKKVVILLDEDAKKDSAELLSMLKDKVQVAEVHLPTDMDPGDFWTTLELRQYVSQSLSSQNFSLLQDVINGVSHV